MKSVPRELRNQVYLVMFLGLPAMSAVFLVLARTLHYEFFLHLAAIPLEILLGAFLVERYLHQKERQALKRQLTYIKGYLFRAELRDVYLTNIQALEHPAVTFERLSAADPEELKKLRHEIEDARYRDVQALEAVLEAYQNAQPAWRWFLQWSIENDFEDIFHDMLRILHLLRDVRLCREMLPEMSFEELLGHNPELLTKMGRVLRQGLEKFFDYLIELRSGHPALFQGLMNDYLAAAVLGAARPAPPRSALRSQLPAFLS